MENEKKLAIGFHYFTFLISIIKNIGNNKIQDEIAIKIHKINNNEPINAINEYTDILSDCGYFNNIYDYIKSNILIASYYITQGLCYDKDKLSIKFLNFNNFLEIFLNNWSYLNKCKLKKYIEEIKSSDNFNSNKYIEYDIRYKTLTKADKEKLIKLILIKFGELCEEYYSEE